MHWVMSDGNEMKLRQGIGISTGGQLPNLKRDAGRSAVWSVRLAV